MDFSVRIDRIMEAIAAVAGSAPCNRPSFSAADAEARAYFYRAFDELGLSVRVDGAGNVRAALLGSEPGLAPVLTGSHIDTVRNGGRFDGLAGSVCALECLRVLRENSFTPRRTIEVIIFSEEEGTNFGVTLLGSKLFTGRLAPDALKTILNDSGESADSVIRRAGFDPGRFDPPGDVHAMIEMHIEQGPFLDKRGVPVGVVERIAGMETWRVTLRGVSGHAGATAMADRCDPMIGAADIILSMKQAAENTETGTAVATVGKIAARPGGTNVIAGEVEFYVDIRDANDESIENLAEKLRSFAEASAKEYGLTVDLRRIAKSPAVALNAEIISIINEAAKGRGVPALPMNSGAVHDAVMMTDVTRVGMIFVPSIGGRSHCPEEDTGAADIEAGANVLLDSVMKLAE